MLWDILFSYCTLYISELTGLWLLLKAVQADLCITGTGESTGSSQSNVGAS